MRVLASAEIDAEAVAARLEQRREELRSEVARAEGKLGNEKFVARAPAELVEEEREKLERYRAELEELAGIDPQAYLDSLEPVGWKLGLERMHKLSTALGMPQHRFASIHVVGTNGKSSVTRMIAALLEAHGMRRRRLRLPARGALVRAGADRRRGDRRGRVRRRGRARRAGRRDGQPRRSSTARR